VSDTPRRIILVNRVYWPSAQATAQLLTDLAEGLAARGCDVHVIATGEASSRHQGVTVHRTAVSGTSGGLLARVLDHRRFLAAARARLAQLGRPGDVVVAMTDPPLLGTKLAPVAAARGLRLVHWIQDIYPEIAAVHFGGVAGLLLRPLAARRDEAWRRAAACVTLGADMAGFVAARGATTVHTLPNWAPRELQRPAGTAEVAACREAWGVTDRFVVAYSGNLGRVHEFATVLEAAARLRGRADIVFLFIGSGPRFAEVAAAVRRRRLPNVRLLPPVARAQLATSLSAADAHLVTLRPEYARLVHPSKLAGALAAGRPVIFVGPDGDIARMLGREDCGAVVPPGDGAGLAGLLEAWLASPDHCAALGRRARAAYERTFAFEPALERWGELLRRVAAG
jgi:glycosyltransferase involved in cell wall biosynthesis